MKLTPNFTKDEFEFSQTATRKGIDNSIPAEILPHVTMAAAGMELVRALCGNRPIRVSSGYRCHALNRAVGGAPDSAHTQGWAVDFTVAGLTTKEVVRLIAASKLNYDQCIAEGVSKVNPNGAWVHISFAPRMRRQNLEADFTTGRAIYVELPSA